MNSLISDARLLTQVAWRLSPRKVTLQAMLTLFAGVVGGANLLLLIPIINAVATPAARIDLPLLGSVDLGGIPLPVMLGAFLLLVAIQSGFQRAASINAVQVQQTLVDDLRQEAFEALLAAKWSFVLQRRTSDIIEIVTTGAGRSGMAFQQLLQLGITLILAIATAVVALLVAPVVAGIAILGVATLGLALSTAIRPAHKMGHLFGERNRHLQSVMTDSMSSLRLVRAHDAGAVWAGELASAFTDTRSVQIANTRRQSTITAASQIGLAAAASALVLTAVWQEVPATSIAVILLLVARLSRQVQQMATISALLATALPAVRDLTGLTSDARAAVEVPPGATARRGDLSTDARTPLLEFRDVTFAYPNSTNGVRGLDLMVERGQITVLTGHSGAGKSTTVDLALGLLEPDGGQILVDGQPLHSGDLTWWRSHVAYVPQETVLIPGSLRRNLVWSAGEEISDQACWKSLDQASATFARALPDGLDTIVGDRGLRLSGGERQRVAIARALLRAPALLVLDEATSSLDDATESAVLDLVANLTPAVTVLVIAHRKSTIDLARHVVRLESGQRV